MGTIFEVVDPITGDGLTVELDGERVIFRSVVEARERVLVLTRKSDGIRLAHSLLASLGTSRERGPGRSH